MRLLLALLCLSAGCAGTPRECTSVQEAKRVAIEVLDAELGIAPPVLYDLEAVPVGIHPYIERACQWNEGDTRTGCFIPAREVIMIENLPTIMHEMVHYYIWLHALSAPCEDCYIDADPRHIRKEWEVVPLMEEACGW